MERAYYSDSIAAFLDSSVDVILGRLLQRSAFSVEPTQRDAWVRQIAILHEVLGPYRNGGSIYFEFSVPRLGKRIDAVVIIGPVVFVMEFKVGEKEFDSHAIDQVYDYALDLKNFHESSHDVCIAPVLIPTEARRAKPVIAFTHQNDRLLLPIESTVDSLAGVVRDVLALIEGKAIDVKGWECGRYCPTPTIVEAATALYGGHSVADISRRDADATNLTETSDAISEIIRTSKAQSRKSICSRVFRARARRSSASTSRLNTSTRARTCTACSCPETARWSRSSARRWRATKCGEKRPAAGARKRVRR